MDCGCCSVSLFSCASISFEFNIEEHFQRSLGKDYMDWLHSRAASGSPSVGQSPSASRDRLHSDGINSKPIDLSVTGKATFILSAEI